MIERWCLPLALLLLTACGDRPPPDSATASAPSAMPMPSPAPSPPEDAAPPPSAVDPDDLAAPPGTASPTPEQPETRSIRLRVRRTTAAPAPATPVQAMIYCAALDRAAPAAECAEASAPDTHSADARASLSRPRSMYRGQTARVRFVVVQGADQSAADAGARSGAPTDTVDQVGKVRFTRRMEARLTGQGFRIDPPGLTRIDTGASGEAAWEWRITPERSSAYYLQVEAWTLRRESDRWIRDRPLRYPSYAVAVPVRWWPDRVEDATHDSIAWFGEGTAWLKALAALLTAAAAAWAAWRKLRPPRASGAPR